MNYYKFMLHIENPSLRNEAKLDIVTDELLARMK